MLPKALRIALQRLPLERPDDFNQLVMNFLVMPIFFLSGALYPLNDLPGALSTITSLDPLAYGVDGLRTALTGISHFGLAADFFVLVLTTFVLVFIGSYLFSKIQV